MSIDPLVVVGELSADQWGLLTTRQASARGLTRLHLSRMVERGHLERLSHGVYAQPVALADPNVELRAEWLALQPGLTADERLQDANSTGVVSHASAAGLHDLGSLLDDELHYTLPRPYRSRKTGLRIHRADLAGEDVLILQGLPVTTIPRTITDLLAAGHDLEHVAQILRQAVTTGRTTIADVHAAAGRRPDSARVGRLLSDLLATAELDDAQLVARTLNNPLIEQILSEYARTVTEPMMQMIAARIDPLTGPVVSAVSAALEGPADAAREATLRMLAPSFEGTPMPEIGDLVQNVDLLEQLRGITGAAKWADQVTKAVDAMVRQRLGSTIADDEPSHGDADRKAVTG